MYNEINKAYIQKWIKIAKEFKYVLFRNALDFEFAIVDENT